MSERYSFWTPPDYTPGRTPVSLDAAFSTEKQEVASLSVRGELPGNVELELPDASFPAEKAKHDRIKVAGRLVYAPRVHTFPNGNLRVTLTVAEHRDTGETVYHNAYATKRFAEGIARKELKKGDLVELAGQRQLVTRTDRQGNERQVPVIYAYGVKPR